MKEIETFGDLIRKIRIDKNLSDQDIADKLNVPLELIENFENGKSIPTQELLQKFSGNFGIPFCKLCLITGYHMIRQVPDYYLSDGKPIDIHSILAKVYYKDPSILPRLYDVLFGEQSK